MRLNLVGEFGVFFVVVFCVFFLMWLFVFDDVSLLLCCEIFLFVVYIIRWCLKEGGYMEQVYYELLGLGIVIKFGDLRIEIYIWIGFVSIFSWMFIINFRLFFCFCEIVW